MAYNSALIGPDIRGGWPNIPSEIRQRASAQDIHDRCEPSLEKNPVAFSSEVARFA
jgi:hypothetical protein